MFIMLETKCTSNLKINSQIYKPPLPSNGSLIYYYIFIILYVIISGVLFFGFFWGGTFLILML